MDVEGLSGEEGEIGGFIAGVFAGRYKRGGGGVKRGEDGDFGVQACKEGFQDASLKGQWCRL